MRGWGQPGPSGLPPEPAQTSRHGVRWRMTRAGEPGASRMPGGAGKGAFPGWPSYAVVQEGLAMEKDKLPALPAQPRSMQID